MRKAQTEHGFAKLANELAREISRRAFTARQLSILFLVIPETYGFKGRQFAPLTPPYLAQSTGIQISNVRKALAALLDDRVLITGPDGWIGINPRLDEWLTESRQVKSTPAMSSQINSTEGVKSTLPRESNRLPERVKSTPSTPSNPANNAGLEGRKETIKETKKEKHAASAGFSEEELSALGQAIQGANGKLAISPYEVPLRLRRFLEEKIAKGKLSDSTLDAFDALDRPTKIVWCVRSLEIAKEKASGPGSWLSFAAGVIGRAIESGEDLAPSQSANVVEFKKPEWVNPHADKPWAPLNDQRNFGYRWADEAEQVKYLAGRLANGLNDWNLQFRMRDIYQAEGFDAAMSAMWAVWPGRTKANG